MSNIVCFLTTPNFTLISHLNPSVTKISPWIYASPFSLVSLLFLSRAFRDFTNLMEFVTQWTSVKGTRLISFIYLFRISSFQKLESGIIHIWIFLFLVYFAGHHGDILGWNQAPIRQERDSIVSCLICITLSTLYDFMVFKRCPCSKQFSWSLQ